jgi:four helix bundle suffix protein
MKKINSDQHFLRRQNNWENLLFFKKTVVLYQMTVAFTGRFLPKHGDRTVDQMIQAARSGKQNIIEGSADGVTSVESEIKLLNIARGSIQELREDYKDYLMSHNLPVWDNAHPRFKMMRDFCRKSNDLTDYQPYFDKWSDEEFCNCAITLCYMVDTMMNRYHQVIEQDFLEHGGVKERMTAARKGYRTSEKEYVRELEQTILQLQQQIKEQQKTIDNQKNLIDKLMKKGKD